jgi:hypothetical protein
VKVSALEDERIGDSSGFPSRIERGEVMRVKRGIIWILSLAVLSMFFNACNFPALDTASETEPSTETAFQESPTQTSLPATTHEEPIETSFPVQQDEEQPGGAMITAKGEVDCLVNPSEGSESFGIIAAGETALVLGKTPNGKWYAVKLKGKQKACWVPAMAVELSVAPGDLDEIAPPVTSTPAPGSISGVLWHEICQFTGGQAGEPLVLGQGCVQWGAEEYEFGPNQVYDPFESGWAGVTLHLGAGPCPSIGLATTVTDADGGYTFTNLNAGTYCISYSNLADGNDIILIPGGPTYPERGEGGFSQTISLTVGEELLGVDFGYAFQFYN